MLEPERESVVNISMEEANAIFNATRDAEVQVEGGDSGDETGADDAVNHAVSGAGVKSVSGERTGKEVTNDQNNAGERTREDEQTTCR